MALQVTAQAFARDAAPYCHPRLAAIEQRDDIGGFLDRLRDQLTARVLEGKAKAGMCAAKAT